MIGDGLNDAGALKQSNVGIAISDDTNNFSPACDAVLSGKNFTLLKELVNYCRRQKRSFLQVLFFQSCIILLVFQ